MEVALVNTNRIRPPIAPIGLDYVAEALHQAGHHVTVLDLCWADEWGPAIVNFFDKRDFDLVGITLRNTDDCAFATRQSFLGEFTDMINTLRKTTQALVVLGGVGFSVMPEQVLRRCRADAGLWGDGEFGFVQLADKIEAKQPWHDVAGLIWADGDRWRHNPYSTSPLTDLPPMSRRWVDNYRYFCEGGQAGIETKRGCPGKCIYCADPLAKGKVVRTRPPKDVVDEIENLLEQEIDHIHTCDSEFNLPPWHALEVSEEMIRRNLGDKVRWYAYCSPASFSLGLAQKMRQAGCVGINFGVDNGDEQILRRLRRDFRPDDILSAVRMCRQVGMAVMLDLLIGSPGETRETVIATIDLVKRAAPDRVGVAVGVRVYRGTELSNMVDLEGLREGLMSGTDESEPVFFLEPAVAPFVSKLLDELIDNDEHFFFLDPSRPERDYNYSANRRLIEAIEKGYRGAYWDILRKYQRT
jgi:radical SAM superfamily enzyme YgiQ (UPF0313 family)